MNINAIQFVSKSPINIPQGRSGRWIIKHKIEKAGSLLPVVNWRTAIHTGVMPWSLTLSQDRTVHYLLQDGGVVMADLPIEAMDHFEFYTHARGHVLIGGLGIGFIASKLLEKKSVKSITVIEKSNDVIKLVAPHIDPRITIVKADLFRYLKTPHPQFDTAYYDIWVGTGNQGTWVDYVVPLRRLTRRNSPKLKVWCWLEPVMIGQFIGPFGGLNRFVALMDSAFCAWKPIGVFLQAVKQSGIKVATAKFAVEDDQPLADIQAASELNAKNPELQALINIYLRDVGSPRWERVFGVLWDKYGISMG
jgi:hypothetical protein